MQNIIPVMVYLISGKKNEGKTTKLKELLENRNDASGFIAEKVYDCGRVTTYNLINIRTGDTCAIARLASLPLPENWGESVGHGPFKFSQSGFDWAKTLFSTAQKEGNSAFVIDELGKLELKGKGHAELIRSALSSKSDLYISVRDVNVDEAIRVFDIKDYQIINAV